MTFFSQPPSLCPKPTRTPAPVLRINPCRMPVWPSGQVCLQPDVILSSPCNATDSIEGDQEPHAG
eukprot:907150-Alexandrium_andersonii.AAC.1